MQGRQPSSLTQGQPAKCWNVSLRPGDRWHQRRASPRRLQLCGRVIYRTEDGMVFEEKCLRGP